MEKKEEKKEEWEKELQKDLEIMKDGPKLSIVKVDVKTQDDYDIEYQEKMDIEIQSLDDKYIRGLILGAHRIVKKSTLEMFTHRDMMLSTNQMLVKKVTLIENGQDEAKLNIKYISVFDEWNKTCLIYNGGFDFLPGEEPGMFINENEDLCWNIWNSFKYEPNENQSCDIFLDHIKRNICGGDEEIYKFVMDWLAQMIQDPSYKPGVTIAIRGKEGTGKGSFANIIGDLCGKHYLYLNSGELLTTHFNSILANKLFVFADEAVWGGDRAARDKLKSMITDAMEVIEFKGKEPKNIMNYKRIMFATNSEWVAPVDENDRRYLVIDVAEENLKKAKFFINMKKQMKEGGYEKLMYILLNRDISSRDWTLIPMTKAKIENIILGFNSYRKWIHDSLDIGYASKNTFKNNEWNIFAGECDKHSIKKTVDDMFNMYKVYIDVHKIKSTYIRKTQMGIELKALMNVKKHRYTRDSNGYRDIYYAIHPLKECREYFNNYISPDRYIDCFEDEDDE